MTATNTFAAPRISAALAVLAATAIAGSALAQTPARPRPGQPAAPAAPAGGNQEIIVNLKAEPSQAGWLKTCGEDKQRNKEVCFTTRDFVTEQGQPVLAVAIYDVKGDADKMVRILLPPRLLLRPGIRFLVDKGQPTPGQYTICFPNGCFAEAQVKADVINNFKKGTMLNVVVQNEVTRQVVFSVPLDGFGKAFDGPAIDPKELQEQQVKLQEQLKQRGDDLRKKLEAQRGTAPPIDAPAAPGATPPPAAPKP